MNWDAIGAVGEVGGAIAVVATLGYLAATFCSRPQTIRKPFPSENFALWVLVV